MAKEITKQIEENGEVMIVTERPSDSIQIKKDSKGNYTYEIKLYGTRAEDLTERIFEIVKVVEQKIKEVKE